MEEEDDGTSSATTAPSEGDDDEKNGDKGEDNGEKEDNEDESESDGDDDGDDDDNETSVAIEELNDAIFQQLRAFLRNYGLQNRQSAPTREGIRSILTQAGIDVPEKVVLEKLWGDFQQPPKGETISEFGRQSSVKTDKESKVEPDEDKLDAALQKHPPEGKPVNEFGRHNSGHEKESNTESKEEGNNNSNLSEDDDAETMDLDKIVAKRRVAASDDIDQDLDEKTSTRRRTTLEEEQQEGTSPKEIVSDQEREIVVATDADAAVPSEEDTDKIDPSRRIDWKAAKFFLVHIGKAGGTTVVNNLRTLCVRKAIEHNLLTQKAFAKGKRNNRAFWSENLGLDGKPLYQHHKCLRILDVQKEQHTEMALSKRKGAVVGYMHMNFLKYWWNANDHGEAKHDKSDDPNKFNVNDMITGVLEQSGGGYEKWKYNITAMRDPVPVSTTKDHGLTDATAFLIPIRDPIDRLVSAYHYHHPANHIQTGTCASYSKYINKESKELLDKSKGKDDEDRTYNRISKRIFKLWQLEAFFCKCFPTIQDLADVYIEGSPKSQETVASCPYEFEKEPWMTTQAGPTYTCLELAQKTLRGQSVYTWNSTNTDDNIKKNWEPLAREEALDMDLISNRHKDRHYMGHISLNFGYYYRRTIFKYPDKDLVVLRTEHLWEDLQGLEKLMGGDATIGPDSGHEARDYGSKNKYVLKDKVDDPERLQALCCALSSEYQIYKQLLISSKNLSGKQVDESIRAMEAKCNLKLCGK